MAKLESLGQLVDYEVWRCEWSTVLNPRGPCERCQALDGKVFEVGVGPQVPLHPYCKCRRVFHHSGFKPLVGRRR